MGVKDFTKVFPAEKEIKFKDLNGKHIAIDASVEIYRAALGMSSSTVLRDADGNPTSHINTILLGLILKLKASGAFQYWIFDYNSKGCNHNPMKELELKKRRDKRCKANEKLKELKELTADNELFSDSDEEPCDNEPQSSKINKEKDLQKETQKETQNEIDKQEKIAFVIEDFYKDDVIFMLNQLDVPWLECPPGFEAEQIAAMLTFNENILGFKINYVLTPDADCLLFGAKKIIKRDIRKKKFFEYNLSDLLKEYELQQDDLTKIGLILGTDFANKTPRIGPKTVLKKYKDIVLSEDQQKAFETIFKKQLTDTEIKSIIINNQNVDSFTNKEKYEQLLDWIELVKSFNRSRIDKLFKKNMQFL